MLGQPTGQATTAEGWGDGQLQNMDLVEGVAAQRIGAQMPIDRIPHPKLIAVREHLAQGFAGPSLREGVPVQGEYGVDVILGARSDRCQRYATGCRTSLREGCQAASGASICSCQSHPSATQTCSTPRRLVTFSVTKGAPHLGQGRSTGLFHSAFLHLGYCEQE
jgi:hypothetical protein